MCQRGRREAEEILRKLGKVSSGKGIAVGQSWTAGTTSEPLLRRRKSTFKKQVNEGLPLYSLRLWVHNNGCPLITASLSLLAQGFPSLLHPGALYASIHTVLPLPHQDPSHYPRIWLASPDVFFLLSSSVPSPLILRALLSLRREVGEKKSHWPLIISNKDLSPWITVLIKVLAVAIKSLSSLIVLFLRALSTLPIQLEKSRAGWKLWQWKSDLSQDCEE